MPGAGRPGFHSEAPLSTAVNVAQATLVSSPVPLAPTAPLSEPDFSGCLRHLQEHFWQSRRSARPSIVGEYSGYFNLGAMFGNSKVGLTAITQMYQESCRFLNVFLRACFPSASWTSICLSRNVQTRLHSDSGNLPHTENHTVSVGSFSKGELWLADPAGEVMMPLPHSTELVPGRVVSSHDNPVSFPCEQLHATMPWEGGTRWAITAYSVPGLEVMAPAARAALVDLGFPLPVASDGVLVPSVPPSPSEQPALNVVPTEGWQMQVFLDVCSGACAPLSEAMLQRGVSCLPIDIIRDSVMQDLLNDSAFHALLRVASSGIVKFAHASPICLEFSRLKTLDGDGPRPIRTEDYPEGLPDLSAEEQARLHTSKLLLTRCLAILEVAFAAGAHVSLEQPRNALSWLLREVQAFLRLVSADLVVIPACSVGVSLHKHWLLASSWRPLQSLAATCAHAYSEHFDIRGVRDADGNWLSKSTAEFPRELCEKFADAVAPLV